MILKPSRLPALAIFLLLTQASFAQTPRRAEDFYNLGPERRAAGDLKAAGRDINMAFRIDPSLKESFEKYLQEMKRRK